MAVEVELKRRCVAITTLLLLVLYHVHTRANSPAFDTDDRGGKGSNSNVAMVHVLEKHLPVATTYQVGTYRYQLGWNLIFSFKVSPLSSGQGISCFETTTASSSSHGGTTGLETRHQQVERKEECVLRR